jgi:hypothetical protein
VRNGQSPLRGRAVLRRADRAALFVEKGFGALERRVARVEKGQFEIVVLDRMRNQAFRLLRIGAFAHELEMELSGVLPDGLKRLHDASESQKIGLLFGRKARIADGLFE